MEVVVGEEMNKEVDGEMPELSEVVFVLMKVIFEMKIGGGLGDG